MLNLLRNMPPRFDGQPRNVEAFFRLTAMYRERGALAGFWTSRRPRRTSELKGGSVYFAVKGETVFRLPFVRIERVRDFAPHTDERWLDAWAIVCRPETTLVEARRVYRLQGWRYLAPEDAPADIGATAGENNTQDRHAPSGSLHRPRRPRTSHGPGPTDARSTPTDGSREQPERGSTHNGPEQRRGKR